MKYIYNVPIAEVAQTGETDRLAAALAESGVLDDDGAAVESVSQEAADLQLAGQYRVGEYSRLLADELEELANSSLTNLPLYRREGEYSSAGYYEIESADVSPAHPATPSVYEYSVSLSQVGTKARHFRSVECSPRQLEHEFGTDLEALVSLPASARKVQWLADDGTREIADPVETASAEYGTALLFDLGDAPDYDPPPFDGAPTLIYEVDYAEEVAAGTRVYDTRGEPEKFDDSGTRQWQTVFLTDHDVDSEIVMDNGLLRLRLDEFAGTLEAERWDPDSEELESGLYGDGLYGDGLYYGTEGTWRDVGLEQPEDVGLFDIDILGIGMVRDEVQLTFDVAGDLFALNAILATGHGDVQIHRPDNQPGPIPDVLEDWLEPIASTSVADPQPTKTLVSRRKVRR